MKQARSVEGGVCCVWRKSEGQAGDDEPIKLGVNVAGGSIDGVSERAMPVIGRWPRRHVEGHRECEAKAVKPES